MKTSKSEHYEEISIERAWAMRPKGITEEQFAEEWVRFKKSLILKDEGVLFGVKYLRKITPMPRGILKGY